LIVGARGQFDVVADGELIFSKADEQRFPEPEEIIGSLRSLSTSAS
jgi:selT/selW/selH-like putative selenoprotein